MLCVGYKVRFDIHNLVANLYMIIGLYISQLSWLVNIFSIMLVERHGVVLLLSLYIYTHLYVLAS